MEKENDSPNPAKILFILFGVVFALMVLVCLLRCLAIGHAVRHSSDPGGRGRPDHHPRCRCQDCKDVRAQRGALAEYGPSHAAPPPPPPPPPPDDTIAIGYPATGYGTGYHVTPPGTVNVQLDANSRSAADAPEASSGPLPPGVPGHSVDCNCRLCDEERDIHMVGFVGALQATVREDLRREYRRGYFGAHHHHNHHIAGGAHAGLF